MIDEDEDEMSGAKRRKKQPEKKKSLYSFFQEMRQMGVRPIAATTDGDD